jgi:hypothetical protein
MSLDRSKNKNDKLEIYDEILRLVEEEIHQRRNGQSYQDISSTKGQTGGNSGNFQTGGLIPGKFDIVRHSLEVPLDVAIRGTVARQQLYAREKSF